MSIRERLGRRIGENRPGEFGYALVAVWVFAVFYTVLVYLRMFYLPDGDSLRRIWIALGFAAGAAAVLTAGALWLLAIKRNSSSLLCFRELLRELVTPGFIILAVWLVWACVAWVLTVREGLSSLSHNSSYIFDMFVSLMVLFPMGCYMGKRGRFTLLNVLMDTGICLHALLLMGGFLAMALSADHTAVIFGRSFGYTLEHRLAMGAYVNTTGAYGAFFAMAAIYRLCAVKKPAAKVLYGLSILLFLYALVQSDSRASILSFAAFLFFLVFVLVTRRLKVLDSKAVRIVLLVIGVAALLCLIMFLMDGANSLPFRAVTAVMPRLFGSERAETAAVLGGRTLLWDTIIQNIRSDPHLMTHGCSPATVIFHVFDLTGEQLYTHNQFLEVFLGQGVPAVVMFTLWVCWLCRRCYGLAIQKNSEVNPGCWILPVIILALLVCNMAEAMLVSLQHYIGSMFFLTAGYIGGLTDPEKKPVQS